MSLDKLNVSLAHDVAALEREGRAKAPERVLTVTCLPPALEARGIACKAATGHSSG